jgi:peptide/nickel transport system permease protein
VDAAIGSLFDTIFAFPAVLLGIALVALLGSGIPNVVLAVAAINVPTVGRLTRVAVQTQLAQDYVEAARAIGANGPEIAVRHVLPNIAPPLLVQTTVTMAGAVLLEAAFSFLGLGSRPPTPSWGAMLDGGRAFLAAAPWLGIFPGLAISLMVLGLNSLGDALQAALDPRRP